MVHKPDSVYPSKYETELSLEDGSKVLLRPIKREDAERWLVFVNKLGIHTRYLRFHHVPREMRPEDATYFCTVDYTNTFALVAEVLQRQNTAIIAVGRYYRLPDKRSAEVAFVVEDAYQGMGIGTYLIKLLAKIARDNGIISFEADVLAENENMMAVFKDCGFPMSSELDDGVYHITIFLN